MRIFPTTVRGRVLYALAFIAGIALGQLVYRQLPNGTTVVAVMIIALGVAIGAYGLASDDPHAHPCTKGD